MKEFGSQIHTAVHSGRLAQPFSAAMVKRACPGWADRTYHTFLGKHEVGNGNATELFERVDIGLYRLKDPTPLSCLRSCRTYGADGGSNYLGFTT